MNNRQWAIGNRQLAMGIGCSISGALTHCQLAIAYRLYPVISFSICKKIEVVVFTKGCSSSHTFFSLLERMRS